MEKYLEEIKERYEANQKQIDYHDKELNTLYDNKRTLIKEFCDGLCKKYAEFIGKYVKVKFKDSAGYECEADGFLLGFVNLTSGHVCACRFDSPREAIADMDNREDVISYEVIY